MLKGEECEEAGDYAIAEEWRNVKGCGEHMIA